MWSSTPWPAEYALREKIPKHGGNSDGCMVGSCNSIFCVLQTMAILLVPCSRILCFFPFLPLHLGLAGKARGKQIRKEDRKIQILGFHITVISCRHLNLIPFSRGWWKPSWNPANSYFLQKGQCSWSHLFHRITATSMCNLNVGAFPARGGCQNHGFAWCWLKLAPWRAFTWMGEVQVSLENVFLPNRQCRRWYFVASPEVPCFCSFAAQ